MSIISRDSISGSQTSEDTQLSRLQPYRLNPQTMPSISLKPLLRVSPVRARTRLLTPLTPIRTATLLRRPKRPHQFDQMVILTDGSAFKQLTTSPRGVYRTTKDTRNHALWNESDAAVMGLEDDEAGKLKSFRNKYGHGFDALDAQDLQSDVEEEGGQSKKKRQESMMDILNYQAEETDMRGGKKK